MERIALQEIRYGMYGIPRTEASIPWKVKRLLGSSVARNGPRRGEEKIGL